MARAGPVPRRANPTPIAEGLRTFPHLYLQIYLCKYTVTDMTARRLEMTAPAVKALAHPLRVQIFRYLELHKRASVTSLADELGETTGAISYHLRQLARHGFVEEFDAEEPDTGRVGRKRRWWRMAVDEIHSSGYGFLDQDDTREAFAFLLREEVGERARRHMHWYTTAREWSGPWQRASSDSMGVLDLDAKQARALADDLAALTEKYRNLKPGRGARPVELHYAVFPSETGDRA
jgi:DNA-binding transcriptional ArsR family regulator